MVSGFPFSFEPMAVCETFFSNIPIVEECVSVYLTIKFSSVEFLKKSYFNPQTCFNGIIFISWTWSFRFHYAESDFWDIMSSLPAGGYFVLGDLKIMWDAADA